MIEKVKDVAVDFDEKVKTVAVDFDGVLHCYSGWVSADQWDAPLDGAKEFLVKLKAQGYRTIIHTVRSSVGIWDWLRKHQMSSFIHSVEQKPRAVAYIDDRAIRFDGNYDKVFEQIEEGPYWKSKERKGPEVEPNKSLVEIGKAICALVTEKFAQIEKDPYWRSRVRKGPEVAANKSLDEICRAICELVRGKFELMKEDSYWESTERKRSGVKPKKSLVGIARAIGELVTEKNVAYGNSFEESGKLLRILFPNGVPVEKYRDLLTITRIIDKIFRIATDKGAMGEDPWRDIAGYSILSLWSDQNDV